MSKEQEYKDMFYAEAFEQHEELNQLFTELEKDPSQKKAVDAIFRITHTLKGNAMGLGFTEIAEMAHVMEDLFSEVKAGNITLEEEMFANLFRANDKLGELIHALKTGEKVSYKGIRTKLQVFLKNATVPNEPAPADDPNPTEVVANHGIPTPSDNEKTSGSEEESTTDDESETPSKIAFSDQVQVPVRKLDHLLNLVGELIIEKDGLSSRSMANGRRGSEYSRLHRITSDLQYAVMGVRLIQVGFMFNKFHRIVRDVAQIEQKKVNLNLSGTEIEIDRNILKIMSDSLVHLVRNAVSHGIESPEERVRKGKPESGQVTLSAKNEKDTVIISISDDGNGIDHDVILKKAVEKGIVSEAFSRQMTKEDIHMLIFEPGFSNAETITEVSGRGVGMDVVKRATESIGGKVSVKTQPGEGTVITLALPSSMAVKGALLFEINEQQYAVPLSYTEAVVSLRKEDIHKMNGGLISTYLDHTISIVFLKDIYDTRKLNDIRQNGTLHRSFNTLSNVDDKLEVLIVAYGERYVGLVVDKLLQQKEIVEKTLSSPLDRVELFSGATILGNGNVCLVLDIATILRELFKEKMTA